MKISKKIAYTLLKKTSFFACFFVYLQKNRVPLIGFHSVGAENEKHLQHISFSKEEFEKRIQYISKNYTSLHFSDFDSLEITNKKPFAVVYFDDGYKDNLEIALPILQKYNVKATICIATSSLEQGQAIWPIRVQYVLNQLKESEIQKIFDLFGSNVVASGTGSISKQIIDYLKNDSFYKIVEFFEGVQKLFPHVDTDLFIMMAKEDLMQYLNCDILQFASHSHTHVNLTKISEENLLEEILKSKDILENILGKEITVFSMPFGRMNHSLMKFLSKSGYTHIISTKKGLNKKSDLYKDFVVLSKVRTAPYESFEKWKVRLSGLN